MASIMTGIELQDRFSSVLYGIIDTINIAMGSMYDMSEAMSTDIDTSSLQVARDKIAETTVALDEMNAAMESPNIPVNTAKENADALNRSIDNNIQAQNKFNNEVEACQPKVSRVESGFKGWEKAIIVANNAIGLVKNVLGSVGVMDMSGAFTRIDTMNRFQKTVTTITGDANLANAALSKLKDTTLGTAYGLDVASKATQGFVTRGMSLGAATEQVRIWADAVSFYGEGTNEQLESVVDAIGKMYSKGTVEADQLDRLFDAGIGAAEIYANAVGESVSDVKDQLSDGTISAAEFINVVSQAMDTGLSNGAAKNAGATWATTFANMGAAVNRGWVEVINNLDAALASKGLPSTMEMAQMFGKTIENTLDTIANHMDLVVNAAVMVGDALSAAGDFVVENWSMISPVVYGVVAALVLYATYVGITNAVELVSNGIKIAACIASYAHAAATGTEASATAAATATQYGLNTALLSCPLTWIILLIIALIVVIALVCTHIANMGGTAQTAFGVFCGAVNVGLQFFKNFGLTAADVVIAIWNVITAIAGNIPIAFHNGLANAEKFFYDFASAACGVILKIANALNSLPFVEFDVSGLESAADTYASKAAAAADSKQEYNSISDAWDKGMNTYDAFKDGWVQDAYKSGAEWGDGVSDKVSDKFSGLTDLFNQKDLGGGNNSPSDYSSLLGDSKLNDIAANTGDTAGDTARIADSMDITDEDLKYLRDIAEREVIDRTVFTEVNIDMGGVTNQVNSMSDLDAIPDYINGVLNEQIDIGAEG